MKLHHMPAFFFITLKLYSNDKDQHRFTVKVKKVPETMIYIVYVIRVFSSNLR